MRNIDAWRPQWPMILRHRAYPVRRAAPGSCGGNPQFWPPSNSMSGGAPTAIAGAHRSGYAHVS